MLPKRHFLLLLNLILVISSVTQISSYIVLGLYTAQVLQTAALAAVCVGVGMALGFLVQDRVNQKLFNRFVVVVVFSSGLNLVIRAFTG